MEISDHCGGATLHRVTSSCTRGDGYLEASGRNFMLGPEDMADDENAGDVGGAHAADVVRLVTMNVAGIRGDLRPAAARMDEILTKLLADEKPDVLCFQEVTDEMYRERTARSLSFDTEPLCGPEPWPFPFKPSVRTSPSNLPIKPAFQTSPSNLLFESSFKSHL